METASQRRRRKLTDLCDRHTVAVVAKQSSLNPETLTQIIKGVLLPPKKDGSRSSRGLGDPAARAIEAAFNLGLGWFDRDDQSPLRVGAPIVEAHFVSQDGRDDVPLLSWEDIVDGQLPESFAVRLVDDAMAPRAPAGAVARFQRANTAKQGDGVLVRDRDGNLFFRRLQERTPGHWRALPGNDAYAALDSIADGLVVVGVLTGLDARWSEAY